MSTFLRRAAVLQGLQQTYILLLWYWGGLSVTASAAGREPPSLVNLSIPVSADGPSLPVLLVVCVPVALVLLLIALLLLHALPAFYHSPPPAIPSFSSSLLLRRKLVPYFLLLVAVQNYTLSPLYGRTWLFLFASPALPQWGALLVALGFFVGLWAALFWGLHRVAGAATKHPWLLPVLAVGLGSPRWAQTLWACSGVGLWLPWTGGALVTSALASRLLWLWLGVLDSLQAVGLGLALLLTLGTRLHVAGALTAAQVVGAAATIAGRATPGHGEGPGDWFPDLLVGGGIAKVLFWVGLVANLAVWWGVGRWFRREQVGKP